MKKTYDVYSIFEKTIFSSAAKATAFLSVFLFCFLGVMSDATAQDFINADNPTVALPTVDVDFLKSYSFKTDREDAVAILKEEAKTLASDPGIQTGVYEADLNTRKFYCETLASLISDDPLGDIQQASILAYRQTAMFAANYAIPVDTETIVKYYSDLLNQ